MTDSTLVFAGTNGRNEIVVNFGLFSGRDATPAEVERLAETLLADVENVEIVCEQRYRFDREAEAAVYQVRVRVPPASREEFLDTVEAWARECIAERRVLSP